ncbi:MAG TPA: hypothetical protein PLO93_03490 [Candidatus Omnitrophota bacterium]|nr:hypothetical protein [Candidatus Omnitrophota bacterium]HQL41340.1 hypothetical protein [Candidatus Omnitrophota bacterium]
MNRIILFLMCATLCLVPSEGFAQKNLAKDILLEPVSLDNPEKIMEALSGERSKDWILKKANIYLKVVSGGTNVTRTGDEISLHANPLEIQTRTPKMVSFFVDHSSAPDPAQYCLSARFSIGSKGSQKAYIWLFENFLSQHHGYKLTMDIKNNLLTVVEYDTNGNIIKTYEQSFYELVPDRTYFFGAFYNYDTGFFNFEIFQTKEIHYGYGKSFDLPIFLSAFQNFGPPISPGSLCFGFGAENDSEMKVWDWAAYITHASK